VLIDDLRSKIEGILSIICSQLQALSYKNELPRSKLRGIKNSEHRSQESE